MVRVVGVVEVVVEVVVEYVGLLNVKRNIIKISFFIASTYGEQNKVFQILLLFQV